LRVVIHEATTRHSDARSSAPQAGGACRGARRVCACVRVCVCDWAEARRGAARHECVESGLAGRGRSWCVGLCDARSTTCTSHGPRQMAVDAPPLMQARVLDACHSLCSGGHAAPRVSWARTSERRRAGWGVQSLAERPCSPSGPPGGVLTFVGTKACSGRLPSPVCSGGSARFQNGARIRCDDCARCAATVERGHLVSLDYIFTAAVSHRLLTQQQQAGPRPQRAWHAARGCIGAHAYNVKQVARPRETGPFGVAFGNTRPAAICSCRAAGALRSSWE
jgi:hypothetical protein